MMVPESSLLPLAPKTRHRGFTLLEIVIVLAVTGLLVGGMVTLGFQVVNSEREDKTIEHLKRLKVAIKGKPLGVRHGIRTSFGYLGDMGVLPPRLENLYIKDEQTPYAFFPLLKAGAGWNGPYLDPEIVEYFSSLDKDSFAQNLQYSTTPFTDSTIGQTAVGRINSLGRDGMAGTSDDLSVQFFTNELYSTVSGFVRDREGNGVGGVTIAINYPSDGTLTSLTNITDGDGFYSFNGIPYGNHSLSLISSGAILALDSGQTLYDANSGFGVVFTVVNISSTPITINSLTASYNINPTAYYENLYIGNDKVFNRANPRVASGETISFPAVALPVAAIAPEAVPICVQAPVTEVPDIYLDTLGRGTAVKIKLEGFYDSPDTSGSNYQVNMKGVPFVVIFSDGSVISFTP